MSATEYKKVYNNLYTIDERKDLIAQTIKALRESNGYTQTELSEIIGINKQTYNSYEKGRATPPAEIIIRLSYLYNIPTDIILQRDNLLKSPQVQAERIDQLSNELQELKEKAKTGNSADKEQINSFILGLEQMLNSLK